VRATEGSTDTGEIEITSAVELRELLGEPVARAVSKEWRSLHPYHRAWIEHAPLYVLATAAADGTCDASPKGDPAGSVLVLDDTTIVIPERPGNRRADGYLNVLSNPHVGVLFVVPGRGETLRVNGRARLVRDAPYFDQLVVRGHRPVLALLIDIEQVFFHCSKAFKRSGLWEPSTWGDPDELPSPARLSKDVAHATESLAELEVHYGPAYDAKLYG
jgi:PPOX class probable FMN-dependent enzyme